VSLIDFLDDVQVKTKTCIYCNEEKAFSEFQKHLSRFDGHDGRCKSCIRKRINTVKEIRKTAPQMSLVCDCCGKKPGDVGNHKKINLCLDHDTTTDTFRGWLCSQCNTGIGLLGDDLESVMRAVNYLKRKL
jgi:hypothetical protein